MSTNTLISRTLNNRYKISVYLGGGGFGDTYLANDLFLPEKPVCVVKHLKIRNLNHARATQVSKLFDKEAKFLYQLGNSHPQIPQLLAHFPEDEEFYLVQEFIDGYDLTKEIIPGVTRSEAEVSSLLIDILEVLAFVHGKGIIHRDIKPQNLMRRRDRKIVLIDFGAVKEIGTLRANAQGQSSSTVVIGTFGYMPVEQQNSHPQFSSDVYAVGIVAFQAIFLKDLSGRAVAVFDQKNVSNVNFSPDGKQIAMLADYSAVLWNLSGQKNVSFKEDQETVSNIAISSDWKSIATVGEDKIVRLWDQSGKLQHKLKGHQNTISQIRFSPDSQRVVTLDAHVIRLWSLSGEQIAQFEERINSFTDVTFSPDGKKIAVVFRPSQPLGGTSSVRILPVENLDQLLERSCNWLQDYLHNNPNATDEDRQICGISTQR